MAARGGINAKGEAAPQPVKVQRYWPGRAPKGVKEYLSSEDEDEEEQHFEKQKETELITSTYQIEISEQEAASDRRLRRLREAKNAGHETSSRRRRHADEDTDEASRNIHKSEGIEDEDEDDITSRRQRLREHALEQRRIEEEQLKAQEEAEKARSVQEDTEEEEESEEEGSSEYETDSSEEQQTRKLLKPVFIPRAHRETILEKERLEKEAEEAEQKRLQALEERKKESHALVAEQIQKELTKTVDEETGKVEVDDTDGLDEQAEYEAWKLRELKRVKRDREEREARENEREEIERRRQMSEDVRFKEDLERARKSREEKSKGKYRFLQKYYHKGAFYLDSDDKLFKRDYTEATPDEAAHKELLPKIMQVKNFGRAGQTKWTHLADQDTSTKDSPWRQKLKRTNNARDDIDRSRKRRTRDRN